MSKAGNDRFGVFAGLGDLCDQPQKEEKNMKYMGFHHIGLRVTDIDRSADFYRAIGARDYFSFPISDTGKRILMLKFFEGAVVELLPQTDREEPAEAGWVHIALSVDDCRAAFARALAAGAKTKQLPEEKFLGEMHVWNAFVIGPDDETIEFFQVMAESQKES